MDLELHQLDLRYQALRRRSARKERSVLASLSEIGQQAPVVVLAADGARPILLDGYKRVRALGRLGRDTVRAVAWSLPEPEALLLERLMRSAEADSALEQGWLLRELSERFSMTSSELARRFDKSQSWVSRRLALVRELPESIQDQVRKGELVAHAAMKHLVPLARAKQEDAERLAQAIRGRQFSSRDIGVLCAAWRVGPDAARKLILETPELVLRARAEAEREEEPVSPAHRLLADLGALAAISRRAARSERASRAGPSPELHRAIAIARGETESLFALLAKETVVAGPDHPRGDS